MDTILVVNAGSSSLKFQVFAVGCRERFEVPGQGPDGRNRYAAAAARVAADKKPLIDRSYPQGEVKDLPDAIHAAGTWLQQTQPVQSRCSRASRRAWRARLCRSGLDQRARAGAARRLQRAGSAASAEQSGPDPRAARAPSGSAPGRLLRYGLSSHPRRTFADHFALPEHFYEEGVRRYGFHGLSYEYVAERLRQVAPDARQRSRDRRPSRQRRLDVCVGGTAAASRARWASRRSTDCRWAPGRVISIPASCSISLPSAA